MSTITAVPGVHAGHWTHASGTTGCTAIWFPGGARGAVAIPGHATGTRELDVLRPDHVALRIDAVCLSGGSAFGLAACDGVMRELEARGVGFDTGWGRVPIVAGAVIFDLAVAAARPDADSGAAALRAATAAPMAIGRVGAGAGARVAKASGVAVPGGFGSDAQRVGAHTVGAAVVLNAYGSIRDGGGWRTPEPVPTARGTWGQNTTLAVVATDAPLAVAQCRVVADMATAALARTIDPAFTAYDGDVVFAVSTSRDGATSGDGVNAIGRAAAAALERAILRLFPRVG
jgi:L-aminopeptidase/D-esterase-like protein